MPIAPKFYLFKLKDSCRIQVSISAGKRIREYTDLYLDEKHWDKKKQRAKPLNQRLIAINKELQQIEDRCLAIDKDRWNKDVLKRCISPESDSGKLSFFEVWDKYLEYGSKTKSPETLTKWKVIKKKVEEFQVHLGRKLDFDDFDAVLYDELIYFYNSQGYANNTTGRHIRFIKSFLIWAKDRKYHNNNDFRKWKGFSEEADLTYMEEDELFHFLNYPFPKGGSLYNVRENFCFRCFTGMRFSDTRDLHPSEIDIKNKRITKTIYKTGDRNHVFPLSKYAIEILERNDLNLHVYNSAKENLLLKDAAKEAGLDRPVKRMIRRGSQRDIQINPLHAIISTHMGKRTFITLSLMRGVPERIILRIVGNKDYKSIAPYIKIVDRHSFEWVEKAWG